MSRHAPGRVYLGAAVIALAAVGARWILFCSTDVRPVFSPDTASYLEYAEIWHRTGQLPPVGLRVPGYPLFLLLTTGPGPDYRIVLLLQQAVGVLSTVLCYALTVRLTGRIWMGLAAAGLAISLIDLQLIEIVLYAEALSAGLVTVAALTLAMGLLGGAGQQWWLAASGFAWTASALTRPIHLTAVVAFAAIVLVQIARGRVRRRPGLVAAVLPLMLVVSYMVYNGARDGTGRVRFATSGYSLLNYLAYPAMYRTLPPEMMDVQKIYLDRAPNVARGHVWSWHSLDALVALRRARHDMTPVEDVAVETAVQAIRARPLVAASIWVGTLYRYLCSYELLHGLLIDNQRPPTPDNIELAPATYRVARGLEAIWKIFTPVLSLGALVLPWFAIRGRRPASAAVLAVWVVVFTVVVANVSTEPFSRQARFRIPLQYAIVALAAAGAQAVASYMMPDRGGRRHEA